MGVVLVYPAFALVGATAALRHRRVSPTSTSSSGPRTALSDLLCDSIIDAVFASYARYTAVAMSAAV